MTSTGNPTFWMKRAYLAMRKALDESLASHGLTAAQLDVLQYVWHNDGMEHRDLLEHLGISSPTLTKTLDLMVAHGFIRREISDDDARVKRIFLMPTGWALHEQLGEAGRLFTSRMLDGFSEREAALFVEWLQDVERNLGHG